MTLSIYIFSVTTLHHIHLYILPRHISRFFHTHVAHKQHINEQVHTRSAEPSGRQSYLLSLCVLWHQVCLCGAVEHWHQHQLACCSFTPLTSLWVLIYSTNSARPPGRSRGVNVCVQKKKKPSTRNLGAIKHFWGLNYSTRLYSNQIYSALIIAHEHKQPAPAALPDLQNPYVRLCYVLVLNRSLRGQSFHLPLLTPVLLHHANQGGHEDKNRKRLLTILYPSPPSLCPNSSPSSLPEPFMSHPDPSVLFLFSCRG